MAPLRLGASWRRWTRGLGPARAQFVYSPEYSSAFSAVPIDPLRGERIFSFLLAEGLLHRQSIHRPLAATVRDLLRVHTPDYLESLHQPGTLTRIVGLEVRDDHLDRFLGLQQAMVGGTLLATELTRGESPLAVNLGGGLHHARADRGCGYCLFNDVAIAIRREREAGFAAPILVVDLDLHDGDGTRSIFAADETVHTYSICSRTWDDDDASASTSIELGDEVSDEAYLEALRTTLPKVIHEVRPELVFYLMGADPAASDSLGKWRVSDSGMLARDRFVLRQIRSRRRRTRRVILLAGGYGTEAWRYPARSLGALLNGGRTIEPPSSDQMTLDLYRRVAADLYRSAAFRDETGDPDDWSLTEEEIFGALGGAAASTHFLDYYSRHALEIALERSGLFDRLRGAGFKRPTVRLDLSSPAGHTARIFAGPRQEELLGELRARRDRATLPDFIMLRVEWLLLQNPRASFSASRPRLPGQKHPGLGMLRDVVTLLILVCERLGLDGLLYVPSHYHLAAQAGKDLDFADPEDAGRFRALQAALADLPLAAATAAVSAGKVRIGNEQIFTWIPSPMVLAVSAELKERLASDDYRHQAEEASHRYSFHLQRED